MKSQAKHVNDNIYWQKGRSEVTKVVFQSTSTFMNKVTKLRDEIWKILTKQIFTTFAEPDQDTFTSERGSITPETLEHLQKTMQFLFTNKQKIKKIK